MKSLGSRLVSGNSHEHSGPIVMEAASARTRQGPKSAIFRRRFLSTSMFSRNIIAQCSKPTNFCLIFTVVWKGHWSHSYVFSLRFQLINPAT